MARIKRIAAAFAKERKSKGKFIVAPVGPFPRDESLPLLVVIRDILKLAETGREARKIINSGEVLVDGRKCKNKSFGLGLMNVISLPLIQKYYRVVQTRKGLDVAEIGKNESNLKICKIINKTVVKSGRIQYNFYGGNNLLGENLYKVGDAVLLRVPDNVVEQHLPMAENTNVLIFRGKNKGLVSKVKRIENKMLVVDNNGREFEVPKDFVMVVGEKPAITLGVNNE